MRLSRIIVSGVFIEISIALVKIIFTGSHEFFGRVHPAYQPDRDRMFIYFSAETFGMAVFAFLFGWWATRKNDSKFLLSGILAGFSAVIAFVIDYLIFQVPFHIEMYGLGLIRMFFVVIGSSVSLVIFRGRIKRESL